MRLPRAAACRAPRGAHWDEDKGFSHLFHLKTGSNFCLFYQSTKMELFGTHPTQAIAKAGNPQRRRKNTQITFPGPPAPPGTAPAPMARSCQARLPAVQVPGRGCRVRGRSARDAGCGGARRRARHGRPKRPRGSAGGRSAAASRPRERHGTGRRRGVRARSWRSQQPPTHDALGGWQSPARLGATGAGGTCSHGRRSAEPTVGRASGCSRRDRGVPGPRGGSGSARRD